MSLVETLLHFYRYVQDAFTDTYRTPELRPVVPIKRTDVPPCAPAPGNARSVPGPDDLAQDGQDDPARYAGAAVRGVPAARRDHRPGP